MSLGFNGSVYASNSLNEREQRGYTRRVSAQRESFFHRGLLAEGTNFHLIDSTIRVVTHVFRIPALDFYVLLLIG